ncbi:hypothetical protein SAMN05428970_3202 [Agromyces sp. CF514]|uniref:hypothetical protein n=1 Tax=Agromyces sp. CF514 TaxID=1881031 RepID=UPI0008E40432|nr:hypothetical protein [Agromyces sp. CF514]SFR85629.1 hypothetical protein SAMN05428970_3202 [Agromyces sp. CF514]
MVEIVHGVMLLGAVAGTVAALAPGRRMRVLDALAAVVMAAAMLDTAFTRLLPGLAWSALLVAAGLAIGVRARRDIRRPEPMARCGRPLADLHHALALIATGWLLAGVAASSTGAASASATSDATSAAHHAGPVLPLQSLAVLAVVVLGAWVAARAVRSGRVALRHGAMAAGMSLMLAAMAAPAAVTALGS